MHLRGWAYSTSNGGARSPANHRFLDNLLNHGSLAAAPGMAITINQVVEQGIPCIRLHFHLPQVYHSTGVATIPVLVPTACVGTGRLQPLDVFYSLVEEIIGWLAQVGTKSTLVRVYVQNQGRPLVQSYSSNWQSLHNGFALFVNSLRQPGNSFPGLGQLSGTYGVVEVTQARTSSGRVSADYIVTLTLNTGQRMSLYLPRSVAQLPKDWLLDWLEIQNEFSHQVQ